MYYEENLTKDKTSTAYDREELIKINYGTEHPTVSARDLYEGLEIKSNFSTWFERMCEYGFEETDYSVVWSDSKNGNAVKFEKNAQYMSAKGYTMDAVISVDMAKQICMIQRTEKGKQYRQYFLDLEKAWNTPEQIFARALKMADATIQKLKDRNAVLVEDVSRMKPKEEFFDAVAESKDAIEIGKVAKVLNYPGIGRNKLFDILRKKKILMQNNIPYQKYIDCGYFRTIEQKYATPDGEIKISIKTLVYQKGVDYIRKLLGAA